MPVATVTVRKLKNQSSGLDLSIPTIKEIPGILLDTIEYHVLVVSNLQYFKLPHHKETDVVQFVIIKHFEDFENLRKGLILLYPGTVLPVLSSGILPSFLDSNTSERTAELATFLRFIAATPGLATSHVTLEFLGVNPLTAGKYTSNSKEGASRKTSAGQPSRLSLFEEEKDESSDMFGSETTKEGEMLEEDIFSSKVLSAVTTESSKLFEKPLGDSDIDMETKDLEFFGLGLTTEPIERVYQKDTEDVSKLLEVEDDITKLLKLEEAVKLKKQTKLEAPTVTTSVQSTSNSPSGILNFPSSPQKPTLPPKPGIGKKPAVAQKPQNQVASRADKEDAKGKSMASELGVDDILNYIKENPWENQGEPELFS